MEEFSETFRSYCKTISRSIMRTHPMVRMLMMASRKKYIISVQAILKAEINTFKRIGKKRQNHIAIKILKVMDRW